MAPKTNQVACRLIFGVRMHASSPMRGMLLLLAGMQPPHHFLLSSSLLSSARDSRHPLRSKILRPACSRKIRIHHYHSCDDATAWRRSTGKQQGQQRRDTFTCGNWKEFTQWSVKLSLLPAALGMAHLAALSADHSSTTPLASPATKPQPLLPQATRDIEPAQLGRRERVPDISGGASLCKASRPEAENHFAPRQRKKRILRASSRCGRAGRRGLPIQNDRVCGRVHHAAAHGAVPAGQEHVHVCGTKQNGVPNQTSRQNLEGLSLCVTRPTSKEGTRNGDAHRLGTEPCPPGVRSCERPRWRAPRTAPP